MDSEGIGSGIMRSGPPDPGSRPPDRGSGPRDLGSRPWIHGYWSILTTLWTYSDPWMVRDQIPLDVHR